MPLLARPISSWDQLSPARRGWALGSVLGLAVTLFYFIAPPVFTAYEMLYLFSFVAIPAAPGVLLAETLVGLPWTVSLVGGGAALRGFYVGISAGFNYLFWGGYVALVYKTMHSHPMRDGRMAGFCLFTFFWSVVGMTYAIHSGVVFDRLTPGLAILLVGFLLGLLSVAPLFSYLILRPPQAPPQPPAQPPMN